MFEDPLRAEYLRRHLRARHAAREAGVDLRGCYARSPQDNLESAHGYAKRLRPFHVDCTTQKRTTKVTAARYPQVIASRGRCLNDTPAPPPTGLGLAER